MRVVRPWHRVPREAVAAPEYLEMPKARLDIGVWINLGQWEVSLPMAGVRTGWTLKSLPPQLFWDSTNTEIF